MKIEEINNLDLDGVQSRMAEIESELNDSIKCRTADFSSLSAEVDALQARKKALLDIAAANEQQRNDILNQLNTCGAPEIVGIDKGLEERTAFMNYVKTGEMSDVLKRTDVNGTASNLGVTIPMHVQSEIIKEIGKLNGRLYQKVKKTNLRGGVKYPLGEFDATFTRIGENARSDNQKGGEITGAIEFSYYIGEIRISQSLLQNILAVAEFESEIAKTIAEAFVKAMDNEILNGASTKQQCEGILTNAKVKTITLSPNDLADWKEIQKKVFAKLPLAMRSENYEFVMSAGTWEGNIKTLSDSNNRPAHSDTFNTATGAEICRFAGHEVQLVEPELFKDFDAASTGDVFAMLWVPEKCYAINSNMQFGVRRYFDEDKNQYITKALVINDGKVLRPDMIYLLKKGANPAAAK